MLAVARLGADAYGAAIRDELLHVAERRVSVQTVWVTLVRLEKQGLVDSTEGRGRRDAAAVRVGFFDSRQPAGLRSIPHGLLRLGCGRGSSSHEGIASRATAISECGATPALPG